MTKDQGSWTAEDCALLLIDYPFGRTGSTLPPMRGGH
jgi:hypothetical protein